MTIEEIAALLGIHVDWCAKAARILEGHGLVEQLPRGRWAWKRHVTNPMQLQDLQALRQKATAALRAAGMLPRSRPDEEGEE